MTPTVHVRRGREGQHHDLDDILEQLSHEHFGCEPRVSIEWRRWPPRTCKTFVYARCHFDIATIRVSPVLDQEWVPRFFVGHVVWHELLHYEQHMRSGITHRRRGQRWVHEFHDEAFRAAEARYAHHTESLAWELENIYRLYRSIGERRR